MRIEFNQILIKHDIINGINFKLELKRCADLARTIYLDRTESQLLFPFTFYNSGKPFPNPTWLRNE
jgi:hypothetical protein